MLTILFAIIVAICIVRGNLVQIDTLRKNYYWTQCFARPRPIGALTLLEWINCPWPGGAKGKNKAFTTWVMEGVIFGVVFGIAWISKFIFKAWARWIVAAMFVGFGHYICVAGRWIRSYVPI